MTDIDLNPLHLAGLVKAERLRFAEIYDALAEKRESRKLRLLQVICPPVPAGAPPFLRAFEQASTKGWLEELVIALLESGALIEVDGQSPPTPARIELQKITRPDLGLQDVGLQSSGTERARRRVCLLTIKVDGRDTYGTGFLVGTQAILTSWHVVESLLTPDGKSSKADTAGAITVTFDYHGKLRGKKVAVADQWLLDASSLHNAERGLSANPFSMDMDPTGFDTCLDFAVIRLASPVGRERGFYRLDVNRKPKVPSFLMIFQHPCGYPMHSSSGSSSELWPAGIETRLRHDANTLAGASGGLVLDDNFEAIALHQAGIEQGNNQRINAAIPTFCIAKKAEWTDDVVGVDPLWCISSTGSPVFGRIPLQKAVLNCKAGQTRILVIRGDRNSGKTFSADIVREMLNMADHTLMKLHARELPSDARDFAALLLKKGGASTPSKDLLPDPDNANTARDAWLRDILFPAVVTQLKVLAADRLLWVFIDELDSVPLPHSGTQMLFELLLEAIADLPWLRFILIGGGQHTRNCPPRYVAFDDPTQISEDDVGLTIQRHANNYLKEMTEDTALALARAMITFSADAGFGRFKALAASYVKVMDEQLRGDAA